MLNQECCFLKCFRVFLPTKIRLTSKDEGSSDKTPLFEQKMGSSSKASWVRGDGKDGDGG